MEHALSQLIEQLLPAHPDDGDDGDESAADERYYNALNHATGVISRCVFVVRSIFSGNPIAM